MFPPIFAISEAVQLALVQNFVPIVTVLISLGGAIVSWMGYKKAAANNQGIAATNQGIAVVHEVAATTVEKTEKLESKIDESQTAAVNNAVRAALAESDAKHDKEVADLKQQIGEARLTGERRKTVQ